MLRQFTTKSIIALILGIGMMFGGGMVGGYLSYGAGESSLPIIVAAIIWLPGFCFFMWGCVNLARAKGHSGWFGLVGLLFILGLILLVLLEDKSKVNSEK